MKKARHRGIFSEMTGFMGNNSWFAEPFYAPETTGSHSPIEVHAPAGYTRCPGQLQARNVRGLPPSTPGTARAQDNRGHSLP